MTVPSEEDLRRILDPPLATRFPNSPAARGGRSESLIEFVADRPGHDRRYSVGGAKARRELGFEPQIALEKGLADTVAWYLAHESSWRAQLVPSRPHGP